LPEQIARDALPGLRQPLEGGRLHRVEVAAPDRAPLLRHALAVQRPRRALVPLERGQGFLLFRPRADVGIPRRAGEADLAGVTHTHLWPEDRLDSLQLRVEKASAIGIEGLRSLAGAGALLLLVELAPDG
jgi:hypothetical protein